ncbi:hypothetical protein LSTR_LSTR006929 [Laodelphax striatellus]|uniref:Uncharacterized protein n=1 Tax=Laodelphax striatellus TaxID=195883 RepID=A0A482X4I9_LAOST|nr:hypothetical protein LSTR_LSTR006929 [Laodelphax striatellus]
MLQMKLLAVTTTILSLTSHECHAQLFPWSNLKHYFDQKTKDGPGNGGVLTLPGDQSAESDSHAPSSTQLLDFQDSFDDSSTASTISKHNHKNLHTPFSLESAC